MSYRTPAGTALRVLDRISFGVERGELVCLVGPSGCGKTTLLHVLGGLQPATEGIVRVEDERVTGPPKTLVVLFQQYAKSLLPWRTVERNVHFALENQPIGEEERRSRVEHDLEAVGLRGFERYYPYQLSGGMQQRVAIARALARRSDVLLMDEPFSSLDAMTRAGLQDLLLDLWRRFRKSIVFVTHDIDEAVYLSTRVIVLSSRPGRVLATIANELPYPRDQLRTREDPRSLGYRRRIHELIGRGEAGA